MKHLKLVFACLLMAVFSIGHVWAVDQTATYTTSTVSAVTTSGTAPTNSTASFSTTGALNSGRIQLAGKNGSKSLTLTLSGYEGCTITGLVVKLGSNASSGNAALTFTAGSTTLATIASANLNAASWYGAWVSSGSEKTVTLSSLTHVVAKDENLVLTISSTANSSYFYYASVTYTPASGGGTPEPTVSASPEAVTNVVAAGVNNQSIGLSYENITSYTTSVSVHPNSDGTGTLSPAWLTASISSPYSTVTYTVAANSGAARTAYIKVRATAAGNKEATTIIPVSQVKYTEPTGTFNAYTGALVAGEYVICSGTNAMKNVATSAPRIDVATVTVSENKIQNPDESLVWKIEALTGDDAGKWTIYNEAEKVYAAFNSTDGRGTLIASVTDYAKWTTSGTYDFVNVGKTSKNYLRYNSGYGFASYASTTGSALTLYKKALPSHKVTFTAAPTGGTVAVSVGGSSINTNADVEEGSTVTITPTPSTYYRLVSVTKGGQAITPVQGVYSFTMPSSDVAIAATFELIPVTAVTLNKSQLELIEGATETLSVSSVTPSTARNTVTWSSTNTNVATVTTAGVVTAVAAGNTTIKATSTVSTSVYGSCALTVTAPSGNPITISQTTGGTVTANVADVTDVVAGTSVTLTATPADGYSFGSWTVLDDNLDNITPTAQSGNTFTFDMPDGEVLAEASFTHEEAVLKLHDANGESTFDSEHTHYWKESVTLPDDAAECSKTFMGWSADADRSTAPEIAKGASYTIPNKGTNHLYAVYATETKDKISGNPVNYSGSEGGKTVLLAIEGVSDGGTLGSDYAAGNAPYLVKFDGTGDYIQFDLEYAPTSIYFSYKMLGGANTSHVLFKECSTSDGDYTQVESYEISGAQNSTGTHTTTATFSQKYVRMVFDKGSNVGIGAITVSGFVSGNPSYSDYTTTCQPQVATPTFTVAEGEYAEAQSVEIECATTGATIYYTTNGTEPSTSSTEYTSAISLSNRGAYTIKAIAVMSGCDNSEIASADYTINPPFAKVADLFEYLGASETYDLGNVTVTGYVSEIVTEYSSQHENVSYNISDDGKTTSAQLQAYRGKGVKNGDVYEDADLVAVGDKVTIIGTYKVYNSTKELDANNYIITRIAKGAVTGLAVSGTAAKTVYSNGEAFETTGLVATATYASGYQAEVTPDSWAADPATITASGTVAVTATVGSVTSEAYNVAVTKAAKTLVSIAVGTASYNIYTGQALPQPTVTATYSEGEPEDVSALATYDSESVFDTETTGDQTITVSYTFGGATQTATYTVTVVDYANDVDHPYTVAEAITIINALGTTPSARNIYVQGIVSQKSNPSSNTQTYYISDDGNTTNELEIYKGKYIDGANFTTANQVLVGDEVVVGGKVKMYGEQAEFDQNSELQSLARTPNFEIEDVASLEMGTEDLAVSGLTVTKDGEGAITLVSGDETKATIVENAIHPVGYGTVTITANLAANGIYKAATTTFDVTVVINPADAIGTIGGKFIINNLGDTAVFSRGNLQYNQATNTWRTAENQFEWQGNKNLQMGNPNYNDWVDLFCWSIGAENNYGATSAYHPSLYFNKPFVDWGGLFEGNWSTLSIDQWYYMLYDRPNADDLWGMAMIGDTLGMVLLPGDWEAPSGVDFVPGTMPTTKMWNNADCLDPTMENQDHWRVNMANMPNNKFTEEEWAILEGAGAVFCPYGGRRSGGVGNHTNKAGETVGYEYKYSYYENYQGAYWTSTVRNAEEGKVYWLPTMCNGCTGDAENWGRGAHGWWENGRYGHSVRLVNIIPRQYTVTYKADDATSGSVPTDGSKYLKGAKVTVAGKGELKKTGYTFAGWKFKNQTYQDGDEYTISGVKLNEEIVFVAQWEELPIWATTYTSNVTVGAEDYTIKILKSGSTTEYDEFEGQRYGSGSAVGVATIYVPQGTQKLHFHAAGWNNENITLSVKVNDVDYSNTFGVLVKEPDVQGNGKTYIIATPVDEYYCIDLSSYTITENSEIKFTATGGNRFVLFGVNQEGGVVPVLDHIVVSGELANKDYELGDNLNTDGLTVTAYYTLADEPHHNEDVTSSVAWSYDPLTGGQTSVDVTATYEGKTNTLACEINAVLVPEPEIILSESELAFSGKQYTPVADKTFDVQLKNVAAATIAISGDDAAKFSIDETSLTANGTITVSANTDAAGSYSATITVSDDAHAAASQTVALTLTVTADEAPAWNAEWVVAEELYDGMPILITGMKDAATYAMGAQGNNNRAAVLATVDGNGVLTPGEGTKQFTLEKQDDGTYAIKTTDGKYLYAASSSANHLKTQASVDANAKWTMSVTSASAESSSNRHVMQFNGGSSIFACYATASQANIKLYTPKTYKREISGNIGTICLPNRVEEGDYFGATFYRVMYKKGDPAAPNYVQLEEVGALEAGRPYIFVPNDQENESVLRAVYRDKTAVVGSEVNDDENHGLYGTFAGINVDDVYDVNNDLIYILNSNKIRRCGTNCTIGENRAYIKMDEVLPEENQPVPAPGRRQMTLINGDAPQTPTGMENVQSDDMQCIKIFRNGNIYILRGGKMYDVTGKLVK